jgi:hypothetical protein
LATPAQITFTKLTAFAIAVVITVWMWGDGSGWLTAVAAGVGGYILLKIAIALLIGLYQGLMIRAEKPPRSSPTSRS